NQLRTIKLNRYPRSYDSPDPRKSPLRLHGKRVLVVDDICTNGRSLDCARAYVEAAGGAAVLFAWLKTINTPFHHMEPTPALQPYEVNPSVSETGTREFPYHSSVIDHAASAE